MSVGGIVIEVREVGDALRVIVQDTTYRDKTEVCLEKGEDIQFGDSLWWHAFEAYWTPVDRHVEDKAIKKIGGSVGVKVLNA